jgi:hypothetical protein
LSYAWDLDNDGSYETAGQSANFSAAGLTAPSSQTIGVQVTDEGGLTAVATTTITIIYNFNGYLFPVVNPPAFNFFWSRQVIPVRFSLTGNHGTDILAAGYPQSQRIDCTTLAPMGSAEATVSPGNVPLLYNHHTDRYIYLWQAQSSWRFTCREFTILFDDGASYSFYVRFY